MCIYIQDFLDEAESFPNSPHLDQVDAAAMAFHHLAVTVGWAPEIWARVAGR
jgi:phage terminase large subunit-like protein